MGLQVDPPDQSPTRHLSWIHSRKSPSKIQKPGAYRSKTNEPKPDSRMFNLRDDSPPKTKSPSKSPMAVPTPRILKKSLSRDLFRIPGSSPSISSPATPPSLDIDISQVKLRGRTS